MIILSCFPLEFFFEGGGGVVMFGFSFNPHSLQTLLQTQGQLK